MPASEGQNTGETASFSHAGDIVELVVLTTDDVFLQTLRDAVGRARRLWHVTVADKVSQLLLAGEVGILVLDIQTLQSGAAGVVTQIQRQFPDLVVIVAGGRDDEASLAGLISTGVIYRFIHKPMSPARAKLFTEAAVRKYAERRARVPPVMLRRTVHSTGHWAAGAGIAGLALIITGTAAWALLRRAHSPDPTVSSAPTPAPPAPGWPDAKPPASAANAAQTARGAGGEDPRLAFPSAPPARSRERSKAAGAQNPGGRIGPHPPFPGAGDDRLTQLLRLAAERIQHGQLIDPPSDSARLYIEEALQIDPDTNAAQAAKQSLARALLTEAHGALDRRDFARAAAVLDAADGIVAPPNIDSLRRQLAGARTQAAAEAAERLIETAKASSSPASAAFPDFTAAKTAPDPPRPLPEVISANELTVIKKVPPAYPRRAELDGIQGWVELDFTVTSSGGVADITVHAAEPAAVFNDAAVDALAQWRYKPVERDARPVPQRARIRIRFTLAG